MENENHLWVRVNGETQRTALVLPRGRPIGWATVGNGALSIEGRTVAGVLGRLGGERLPRRYPIWIDSASKSEIQDLLNQIIERGAYFDRAWLSLHATDQANTGPSHCADCYIGLVTRVQLQQLELPSGPEVCVLDNGRLVRPVNSQVASANGQAQTLEQQGASYDALNPLANTAETVLITTPSTPFGDRLRSAHSYFGILHPSLRPSYQSDYIAVRNILLELDNPDLHASVLVRPLFDDRVDPHRIVLDSTTHAAIGLPQGEPLGVTSASGDAVRLRSVVFGNRNAVARVGRTAMIDIEKPITRLPEELFDLLDIRPGERVVVEAARLSHVGYGVSRVTLRALPWRDRSPLLLARTSAGVPDYQELVGDEDFPTISLDLLTREQLGISPGTAVYLRPAVSSELGRQFATVSFALIAAIVSAAAFRSVEVAVGAAALYAVLTILRISRRLRQ